MGDIKMAEKLVRVNSRIGAKQNAWLDKESEETGISKSSLMQMALENYIGQKDAVSAMNNMSAMYEKVTSLESELREIKMRL